MGNGGADNGNRVVGGRVGLSAQVRGGNVEMELRGLRAGAVDQAGRTGCVRALGEQMLGKQDFYPDAAVR